MFGPSLGLTVQGLRVLGLVSGNLFSRAVGFRAMRVVAARAYEPGKVVRAGFSTD